MIREVARKVKPFVSPPTLLLRQAASVLAFGALARWRFMPHWLVRHGLKSVPVSAGSIGMGCIGFPAHPAWEVTSACNLTCIHCHASGGKPSPDQMNTEEARRFIDDLAEVREFRMLVYTGGEPTVRPDLMDLLAHSKAVGFQNVIATNATLIDENMARELRKNGVVGAAVSLDAPTAQTHNFVRNSPSAYELAMRGIRAINKAGILLQINVTAMDYNFAFLNEMIDMADDYRTSIMLMYQLVPVGRGERIEAACLDLEENERLLRFLGNKQRTARVIIEPVAGPQYWPYLLESKGITRGMPLQLAERVFHGCAAGRGFVYIKPNGEVWPCPFVPVNCGNVRNQSFLEIWRTSPIFNDLRYRETGLKGKCGDCRYSSICGGCRGRAMAMSKGDYMAEDPSCFIPVRSRNGGSQVAQASKESDVLRKG
ncbi:MAG TPA: radical SAM protein [Desulfomonilaceae bacterium]|nr:radical SAM protein [Desulfomonilaceae bacterium]